MNAEVTLIARRCASRGNGMMAQLPNEPVNIDGRRDTASW
jgi:hypothetical protein